MKKSIKKAKLIMFLLAVLIVFPLSAYGEDVVNIGVSMPMTGRVASIGIDTVHGAKIAAKEINDTGGLKIAGKNYHVKIRPYDDQANAAKAVAGMQKLKAQYDVPVILTGLSGPTMAMLEQNEKLDIIIMGFFKHPKATKMGNELVLRHHKSTTTDAKQLAEPMIEFLKPETYALISNSGDWGKTMEKAYRKVFSKHGVELVANQWIDERTQTDFRGQLTKVRAAQPDAIMLTAHDESSAGVVKQAHELGIDVPFGLSLGFGTTAEKLTGPELIEGYFRCIEFSTKTPWPEANRRYREELYPAMGYDETVAGFGINAYASVHIITRAMQEAGTTTDVYEIREAVPSVVPLPEKYNTTGATAFKENGTAVIPTDVGRYKDGKLVPLDQLEQ